jgi:thymidine kinase
MRAEKTCFATRKATKYADIGQEVLYICSAIGKDRETDGGDSQTFTSHNSSNRYLSEKVHKLTCLTLSDIHVDPYYLIVIDEAQFFEDIVETVLEWVDLKHKRVLIVGLDSSFKRTSTGKLLELIPHADFYEKFPAKCVRCIEQGLGFGKGTDAIFTLLIAETEKNEDIIEKDEDIIKPGNIEYIPVCRHHYNNHYH